MPDPFAFRAVIPTNGTPITFSGGEGDAGAIKLEHYMTGEEMQKLLEFRGKELLVVIQEAG